MTGMPVFYAHVGCGCPADAHGGVKDGVHLPGCLAAPVGTTVPVMPLTSLNVLPWAQRATWRFKSYYKYRFTFTAEGTMMEDALRFARFTATASAGGDAVDIYRFEVQDPMTWDEICAAGGLVLTVKDADGAVIYQE